MARYVWCLNKGQTLYICKHYVTKNIHVFNKAIHKYFINIHLRNLDRIFDTSNSTQDVYDEFGKPTVQSAMDGFNGKKK